MFLPNIKEAPDLSQTPPYDKGTVGGGNVSRNWAAPNRTFSTQPSRTEPTRTLRWKCAYDQLE